MWKLNLDTEVKITKLKGSKIYTIDNVFAEPKKLERFLFSRHTALVENKEPWQANGDQFLKGRYHDFKDKAAPLVWLASRLCEQKPSFFGSFKTNQECWLKSDYNDWENNYWFPHLDNGYNCIVYFNNDTVNGTNLYDPALKGEEWFSKLMQKVPTGQQPWLIKSKVKLVKHLKPKYNRMVLFDGAYFPHSTAINDNRYIVDTFEGITRNNMRSNLCFFFHPETNDKEI